MTRKEFLDKYPSLNDDGKISLIKLLLLRDWLFSNPEDSHLKDLEIDLKKHINYIKELKREEKINYILT